MALPRADARPRILSASARLFCSTASSAHARYAVPKLGSAATARAKAPAAAPGSADSSPTQYSRSAWSTFVPKGRGFAVISLAREPARRITPCDSGPVTDTACSILLRGLSKTAASIRKFVPTRDTRPYRLRLAPEISAADRSVEIPGAEAGRDPRARPAAFNVPYAMTETVGDP